MTPAELNIMIFAYQENRKENQKQMITHAYYVSSLSRTKKMPKLEKLLAEENKQKKPMTSEAMFEVVKKLNAKMMGGE